MPIQITCPACEKSMRVPEKYAGQRVKCKECGQALTVPDAVPASPARGARYGDTFSPDALPAAATRTDAGGARAMGWETIRVGAQLATWGALLGLVGTVAYAVTILIPMMAVNEPRRFDPGGGGFGLLMLTTTLAMVAGFAFVFQLAFTVAASSICKSSTQAGEGRRWIGAAAILLRIGVLTMVLFPTIAFSGMMRGPGLVILVMVSCVLVYFAGHATFAVGLGRIAGGLGHNSVQQSGMWFAMLEFGIGAWFLISTFLLDGTTMFGGRFAARSNEYAMINLIVWVVVLIAHFFWFRDIARGAARAIADEQQSLVGST